MLEDRDLFYQLLDQLQIPHIQGDMAYDDEQFTELSSQTRISSIIRPSYVIGGKGMERINNGTELEAYLQNNDNSISGISRSIYASFRGRT